MVAVKAHEADRALARLDRSIRVVLFYGPDQGLVSERSDALMRASVADASDPFQMVRLDGADIAGDPLRLVDEANTIGLFGGQRVIRVSATSRPLSPAIEPLLITPPVDAIVILEGGDLPKSNALRGLVERSRHGMAVPCYADQGRSLDIVIDALLQDHGLTIDRDARTLLVSRLGADRQLSRREVEKLCLYTAGNGKITLDDINAIVGDASARDVDDVVDGLFCGTVVRMDHAFTRLTSSGEDPSVLLAFVIRHALVLLAARQAMDQGRQSASDAISGMRGMPFTRKADVETALKRWSAPQLLRALALLNAASAQARRKPDLSRELATRSLWNLTLSGPRE